MPVNWINAQYIPNSNIRDVASRWIASVKREPHRHAVGIAMEGSDVGAVVEDVMNDGQLERTITTAGCSQLPFAVYSDMITVIKQAVEYLDQRKNMETRT